MHVVELPASKKVQHTTLVSTRSDTTEEFAHTNIIMWICLVSGTVICLFALE